MYIIKPARPGIINDHINGIVSAGPAHRVGCVIIIVPDGIIKLTPPVVKYRWFNSICPVEIIPGFKSAEVFEIIGLQGISRYGIEQNRKQPESVIRIIIHQHIFEIINRNSLHLPKQVIDAAAALVWRKTFAQVVRVIYRGGILVSSTQKAALWVKRKWILDVWHKLIPVIKRIGAVADASALVLPFYRKLPNRLQCNISINRRKINVLGGRLVCQK